MDELNKTSEAKAPLEFATMAELIGELARRHSALIVAGSPLIGKYEFVVYGRGSLPARLGLISLVQTSFDENIDFIPFTEEG